MEVALDEIFHLLSPDSHCAADDEESEESGRNKAEGEGEDAEVEDAGSQAKSLQGDGEKGADEDGPVFIGLEVSGHPVELGCGDQVGNNVVADQIPKEMAHQVSDNAARQGSDSGDAHVKEDPGAVLQAEEHENGIEGDEEDQFEEKEESDPKGGFWRIGLLNGPSIEPGRAPFHQIFLFLFLTKV